MLDNQRVKEILKSNKISQDSAATEIGVTRETINKWLNSDSPNITLKFLLYLKKLEPELVIDSLILKENIYASEPQHIYETINEISKSRTDLI